MVISQGAFYHLVVHVYMYRLLCIHSFGLGESLERIEEESSDPLSTRTPSIKKGEVSVDSDGANMDNSRYNL